MAQTFEDLTAEDRDLLQRQVKVVNDLLISIGEPPLNGVEADCGRIQGILASRILEPTDTWELQCLGIALGYVLIEKLGLHWEMVNDEYGRDPALRDGKTSTIIFPLTMISKRVEQGQTVDVDWLVEQTELHVRRLRAGSPEAV